MKTLSTKIIYCCIAFLLVTAVNIKQSKAQEQAQVSLEVQINDGIANSQIVNITDIIASKGSGTNLFSIFLENLDNENPAENLYLSLRLFSDKNGLIVDLYQERDQTFSLDAGQRVFATNSFLTNGLPGVEESINFKGGLTPEGKEFVNELGGSLKLPPDRYILKIDVFQSLDGQGGGVPVASSEGEIGGGIVDQVQDIFLTGAGDAVGSGMEITNSYPEFRWEGNINTQYRIILVEANGRDGPETLIQSSMSTEPILENGSPGTGSLLEYEILDVRVENTSFQMPPSGVQRLEEGKRYYWQVFAELSSTNGTDIRNSEIWEFTLKSSTEGLEISSEGDLGTTLEALINSGQIQELQNGGFKLVSLIIDGQTITGPEMLQQLTEFQNKVNNGDITIVNN